MQTRILFTILLLTCATATADAGASGVETLVLNVDGMWEEECEEYISDSLLGDATGVRHVEADHDNGIVTVDFDPTGISAEEIAAAIENCPMFDVTGSDTHDLDEELIQQSRRSCCNDMCRNSSV